MRPGTLPDDRVFYAMKLVAGVRLRSHAKWMGFRGLIHALSASVLSRRDGYDNQIDYAAEPSPQ